MNHQEIELKFSKIKNSIKKGKIQEALEKLEKFIDLTDDDDLENEIVSLTSRFNILKKDKNLGLKNSEDNKNLNELIHSTMALLRETKMLAIEKASIIAGTKLSELAEKGSDAIEELRKLNLIMAESKLLELKVTRKTFGGFFTEEEQNQFDKNIDDLKSVLSSSLDKSNSELDSENSNILLNIQEKISELLPGNNNSFGEIMSLFNSVLKNKEK